MGTLVHPTALIHPNAKLGERVEVGAFSIVEENVEIGPGTTLTGAKAWYLESEGGWNHYEGAEYTRLRKEMQSTLDRPTREKLARQIQQLMLDEAFTNPVAGVPRICMRQTGTANSAAAGCHPLRAASVSQRFRSRLS